jgi:hypothetical protein
VTVHATCEYAIGWSTLPKTVWNVGSATLTTVMSRIDMIAPRTTTPAIFRTAASILSGYSGVFNIATPVSPWSSYVQATGM